jgi:hypothetical protein
MSTKVAQIVAEVKGRNVYLYGAADCPHDQASQNDSPNWLLELLLVLA